MRYKCRVKLIVLLSLLVSSFIPVPLAAGLLNSLSGSASALTAKIKPVGTFFSNFASSLSNALLNTGYNDRSFMVYSPPAAKTEQPAGTSYGIGYDFGFRGGGDVQMPFGFQIDSLGQYRYIPMTAMLYPGVIPDFTDPTGQKKKPLSLGDGIAPELIKGLLSIFVGGRANAEKAWAPIGYFTTVGPETVFFLKLLTLLNSARKNTQLSGSGNAPGKYPTLADIPYELMFLLFRLVITPDIDATKKLDENAGFGPEKSFRWSKVVTMSRPSKLLGKMPKFFVDLLQTFKPSIDSREIQEYQDRFSAPISDLQQLYGTARTQHPYEARVDYIQNNIIDKVDVKLLNPTDVDLFNYMIRQIISERFRGLKTFITTTVRGSNVIIDDSGTTDSSAASGAVDDPRLLSIDVARMTDFMSNRIPKIKAFMTYLLSDAKKALLSDDLSKYLIAIEGSIEQEFSVLQQMVVDLTNARKAVADAQAAQGTSFADADPTRILEQKVSQLIEDKLGAIDAGEAGELAGPTGNKVAIPLLAYLDIKFWQVMRTMKQSFKGDKDFLLNDAKLSLQKAIVQAYAICFRANLDLSYVENLVKTDSRSFVVQDQQGNSQTITGAQIYKDYTDAERYLLYCEQNVTTYRSSLGKLTPQQALQDQQLMQLTKDADAAAALYGRARASFRHSLRQFEFDRRLPRAQRVGFVALGDASMGGLGDVNVIQIVKATGSASLSLSTTVTPSAGASVATLSLSVTVTPSENSSKSTEASSSLPVDDPMAAFGLSFESSSVSSTNDSSIVDISAGNSSAPSLDDPFSAIGGTISEQTAQQKFLNLPPVKYDYPRTINAFLQQEFARIILRCPDFYDLAQANLDGTVYQLTGMHVNELLQKSADEQDDILKQEDQAYLPGDSFFTSPVPSGAVGSGTSVVDMDALGKALSAKYGTDDLTSEEASAVGSTNNSSVSGDSSASDSSLAATSSEDVGFSMPMTSQEQHALDAEATAQAGQDSSMAPDRSIAESTFESAPVDISSQQPAMFQSPMLDQSSSDQSVDDQSAADASGLDQSMINQLSSEASSVAAQSFDSMQPPIQPSQSFIDGQQTDISQNYAGPTQQYIGSQFDTNGQPMTAQQDQQFVDSSQFTTSQPQQMDQSAYYSQQQFSAAQ